MKNNQRNKNEEVTIVRNISEDHFEYKIRRGIPQKSLLADVAAELLEVGKISTGDKRVEREKYKSENEGKAVEQFGFRIKKLVQEQKCYWKQERVSG
jgi:hypothetical protein